MDKIENPVEFLRENGILFEINRQILHPLGMQLEIELDEDGSVSVFELRDNRASEEPIFFGPETYEEGRTKYEAYMENHGRKNIQKRRRLGLVTQTGPRLRGGMQDGGE